MQQYTPKQVQDMMGEKRKGHIIVDTRTPQEYHLEHIDGAVNMPFDRFDDHKDELKKYDTIIVYCNSGSTSAMFYKRAEQLGITNIYNLTGGLSGCKTCTTIKKKGSLPMMQQVHIAAGSLVLLGIILARVFHGYTWHEYFIIISAFVGAGLVFAGSTGRCGMAKLLSLMPWNRINEQTNNQVLGSDLIIHQFEDKNLAHYSYMAISNREAIVIDPERDPHKYYDFAHKHNATIIGVYNTHPHADFASGHLQIHTETDATIYVGDKVGADYPHHALTDGEVTRFGTATIESLFTPGHSPDSMSFLVKDSTGTQKALFTGDRLFIGDVGRADLRENVGNIQAQQKELAGQMYDSTRSILPRLDAHLTILPAHGAGTSCGKGLSKQNMDTLGNQQKYNPMLQDMTRDAFIAELTNEQPPIPAYFTHSVLLNKQGNASYPACIHTIKHIASLDNIDDSQIVIDTRSYRQATDYPLYDKAINIPYDNGAFVSMIGGLIKPDQHIILIIERPSDKHIIMRSIASIGYEGLIDGIYCREESIGEGHIHSKDITEDTAGKYTILDIRNETTYRDNPLFPHAINIPLEKLASQIQTLDTDTIYLPYCGGSYKSDIALSLLHYHGINAQKMVV